jgi:hypothetical protein
MDMNASADMYSELTHRVTTGNKTDLRHLPESRTRKQRISAPYGVLIFLSRRVLELNSCLLITIKKCSKALKILISSAISGIIEMHRNTHFSRKTLHLGEYHV